MSLRVLFIDPNCQQGYSACCLEKRPLGGTEATVLRVSGGLAQRGYSVVIAQGARKQPQRESERLAYCRFSMDSFPQLGYQPDTVVMLNAPKLLRKARKAFPNSALYLWLHCYPGKHQRKLINQTAVEAEATIVTVSNTLKAFVLDCLRMHPRSDRCAGSERRLAPVETVYNPVADKLAPDGTPVKQDKLIFFSSPHKGLDQVLHAFESVRKECPSTRLCLANPGYWPMPESRKDVAIDILGSLTHSEVITHLRESFCVFYPQNFFRETFGLVFAEANAVGTPVIAHDFGAAREVLQQDCQLVDARNLEDVVARVRSWRTDGRPKVCLADQFRLCRVLAAWENLLQK